MNVSHFLPLYVCFFLLQELLHSLGGLRHKDADGCGVVRFFGHSKSRVEVVVDCFTALAQIECLADEALEDWAFDGVLAADIALDIVKNDPLFRFGLLYFLLD